MAICYLLGMLLRMIRGLREELIPLILGLCSAALGVAGMHLIPDFPARDVMNAAGIGIVSAPVSYTHLPAAAGTSSIL